MTIIYDSKEAFIMVHSIKQLDGTMSRNTLVKAERKADGKAIYRGLTLDDLVIVKKNWGKILKAMAT